MQRADLDEQLERLRDVFEQLLRETDGRELRTNDPVGLVRDYDRPADREVAALVASCLAYGRVEKLRDAIRRALEPLGGRPAARLRHEEPLPVDRLDGFRYRMTGGADLLDLFAAIRTTLREEGSLEALYASASSGDHLDRASHFVRRLRARRRREPLERGFRYLLPDPDDGSACKRLHLFFRWVTRGPDDVDLGLWRALDPSSLVIPLDTHTSRICRYVGLTDRKTVDQKMARQVTRVLRMLDPDDPVKYDFALCHLGIAEDCIHRRSPDHCPSCPLESLCTLEGHERESVDPPP